MDKAAPALELSIEDDVQINLAFWISARFSNFYSEAV